MGAAILVTAPTSVFIGIDPSLRGMGLSDGTTHIVVGTKAGEHLDDRIDELVEAIDTFVRRSAAQCDPTVMPAIWLAIEAPLLRVMGNAPKSEQSSAAPPAADGSHLFELGALMRAIRCELVEDLRSSYAVIYLEVAVGALRHFITGCGNAPKSFVPYMVEQIYGLTFERDRGMDKLVAWSLSEYGRAVAVGEIHHVFAQPRGQGRHSRANARRAQRTRARAKAAGAA